MHLLDIIKKLEPGDWLALKEILEQLAIQHVDDSQQTKASTEN